MLFSGDHCPEAISQTHRISHRAHRSVPRLVNGVHVANPDIDEMVESGVVQGHVVRTTIQLVLMESHQAPMVNQVVHRQPLLEDIPKVLFGILRPKKSQIDDL